MSSFYFNNNQNQKFLSLQAYKITSEKIIQKTATSITAAKENGEDLRVLFFSILNDLGVERRKIAKATGREVSEKYGMRRDHEDLKTTAHATLFETHMPNYRDQIIQMLASALQTQNYSMLTQNGAAVTLRKEEALGKSYSLEGEILTRNTLNRLIIPPLYETYQLLCITNEVEPKPRPLERAHMDEVASYVFAKSLKEKNPSLYRKNKFSYFYYDLCLKYRIRKTADWLIATSRIEVNGKMFALSSYLTWLNEERVKSPVQQMKERSMAYIVRTDRFLIPTLLDEIAAIFEKAVKCNTNNFHEIKKQMTLLHYLFVHTMPFAKGTAAAVEWLEQAVYRTQGYSISYNDEKMAAFEALTSTLGEFSARYDSVMTFGEYYP